MGQTLDVLFEEQSGGYWFGYTPNYIRVGVRSDDPLENVIRPARLTDVRGDIVAGQIAG